MTNIGLIGAGGVAEVHRKAIDLVEGVSISGVFDTRKSVRDQFAERAGAKRCASTRELFEICDAVYILTPPHTHRDLALAALSAGRHVFCEKPLAISLEDGKAIRDAAQNADAKFMVGFSMRYRKSNQELKSMYESGVLGEPLTFWFQRMFGGGGYDPENWRYRPESSSGMSIESLSHQIDTVRWIFGEIKTVYAQVTASHPELPEVDNNVHAVFTMECGLVATIHVSWSSYLSYNTTGINGTQGTVRIWGDGGANHDTLYRSFKGAEVGEPIALNEKYDEEIMAAECRGFVDLLHGGLEGPGGELHPGVNEGFRALEISHAMLTSSRENRVVEV